MRAAFPSLAWPDVQLCVHSSDIIFFRVLCIFYFMSPFISLLFFQMPKSYVFPIACELCREQRFFLDISTHFRPEMPSDFLGFRFPF